PATPGVQRQLEQLMEENRRLQDELVRWRADYARRGVAPPTNPPASDLAGLRSVPSGVSPGASVVPQANRPAAISTASPSPAAPVRTHKVQGGETPSSIAKKYSVKLEALMAANPGLNPKRLQVGQALNVPTS